MFPPDLYISNNMIKKTTVTVHEKINLFSR